VNGHEDAMDAVADELTDPKRYLLVQGRILSGEGADKLEADPESHGMYEGRVLAADDDALVVRIDDNSIFWRPVAPGGTSKPMEFRANASIKCLKVGRISWTL
jgi:hypothetical protein